MFSILLGRRGGEVNGLYLLFVNSVLLDSYASSFMISINPISYHLLPLQPYISLAPIRLSQSIGSVDCKKAGICSLHSISPAFDRLDISQSLLQSLFVPYKSFMLCLLIEIFHVRAMMYQISSCWHIPDKTYASPEFFGSIQIKSLHFLRHHLHRAAAFCGWPECS